jgi:hypothetical protein
VGIETPGSDVYSISWAGVPERSSKAIKIRLYGVTIELVSKPYPSCSGVSVLEFKYYYRKLNKNDSSMKIKRRAGCFAKK